MANENRVRGNLTSGTLSVALSNVDTTMSSAGLANLPAVTAAGHAVIVIENEIIYVTAHTAAATTATIARGKEGTTAAAHNNGTAWVHGPVVSDFDTVLGRATVAANQTAIGTTATDLTGLTSTVTVPYTQHLIRITAQGTFQKDTAAGYVKFTIMEGATKLADATTTVSTASGFVTLTNTALVVPTAASHTYKLQANAENNTCSLQAGATNPAIILVEDLGPAL